eukprot:TRINITY_DN9203_c0_g1_i2.p1 TRINITY_DN9203_c0_g1~~TRINITY_DN9203_c0_g1_i2.p1  ORF type:complete len:215 (+),score=50.47 TRINITY_DN9203_c0_g1_i2:38-646(+)
MALCHSEIDDVIKQTVKQKSSAMKDLEDNKNDPFVSKLFSNGLKKFESSAKVEFIQEVPAGELSGFVNYLASALRVPSDKRKAFKETMEMSVWMDVNDWKEISFIFNLGLGKAKYVSVVAAVNQGKNTIDFLISDVQSTFEMGDDIFVSTYTKKSFFGLFGKTSIKIKKVPAKMTQKSIELIFKFFKIVAFERFAAFRRIPL